MAYGNLDVETQTIRFIESEWQPPEAPVVGSTWRYVNKNGGPDRRFNDNRQVPILHYDEIRLRSPSGLSEALQVSKPGAVDAFAAGLRAMASELARAGEGTPSPPHAAEQNGTPAVPAATSGPATKPEPMVRTVEIGDPAGRFNFDIVGEASCQDTLRRLARATRGAAGKSGGGDTATATLECLIVPEPTNRYDSNAIRVDARDVGTIGYFSREEAIRYRALARQLVDQAAVGTCQGSITGGFSDDVHFGARLSVRPPWEFDTSMPKPAPLLPQLTGCAVTDWRTRRRVQLPPGGTPRPISDEYPFQQAIRAIVGVRDPAAETIVFAALLVPDPENPAAPEGDLVMVCAEDHGPVGRVSKSDTKKHAGLFSGLRERSAVARTDGWIIQEGTRLGVKVLLCEPLTAIAALRGVE